MSWNPLMLVGAGGAVGAVVRYGIARWYAGRGARPIVATLMVNLAGCLAVGMLIGRQLQMSQPDLYALLGTGFLGGLTTYSTLNVQKASLTEEGAGRVLTRYIAATYIGGWLCTAAGFWLGQTLSMST